MVYGFIIGGGPRYCHLIDRNQERKSPGTYEAHPKHESAPCRPRTSLPQNHHPSIPKHKSPKPLIPILDPHPAWRAWGTSAAKLVASARPWWLALACNRDPAAGRTCVLGYIFMEGLVGVCRFSRSDTDDDILSTKLT